MRVVIVVYDVVIHNVRTSDWKWDDSHRFASKNNFLLQVPRFQSLVRISFAPVLVIVLMRSQEEQNQVA